MKRKIKAILILLVLSVSLNTAGALPPPCTPQELLDTSEYAVEGKVMKVVCKEPYDSNECKPVSDKDSGFEPELYSNCAATILVSENLKGNHEAGEKVVIPYVRVARACRGGTHILPGSPTNELSIGADIKYYKSERCRYWNIENIEEPVPTQE